MRFPALNAAMKIVLPTATPEQLVALDTALAQDMGLDCDLSPDDRKAAEDAWRVGKGMAADAALSDADRKAAYDAYSAAKLPVAPGSATPKNAPAQDNAPKLTQADVDAAVAAGVAKARADNAALNAALRAVEPVVGLVAMDNADDVYKAALTKLGVDTKGIHVSAFPALFAVASKAQAAAPTVRPAMDASQRANVRAVVPFLANVNVR